MGDRASRKSRASEDLCGLKVWRQDGRLKFERQSLFWKAVRPAR